MENLTYIVIIVVAFLIIITVPLVIARKRSGRKKVDSSREYLEALNSLLAGDKSKALKKLRETVRKDTSNIDAYIKIGDLLREMDMAERAVKIHRDLTVRIDLTSAQHLEILRSLAKDYHAAKQHDRAIAMTERILALNKKDIWARETQIKLYEEKENWENAFKVLKELIKLKGEKKDGLLALYKVQEGLKLIEEGKEKEGRIRFREAMKIDPICSAAYLYLGDSYIRENRKKDALTILKRFVARVPQSSYLAFGRMKEILFDIGSFGEIEDIYSSLVARNPEALDAHFALAEIYDKKGELEKAVALCHQILEKSPDSRLARQYLVKFYHEAGQDDKAVEQALELIDKFLAEGETFRCRVCGYESEELFQRCPQCNQWEI